MTTTTLEARRRNARRMIEVNRARWEAGERLAATSDRRRAGANYWRGQLGGVPTWALEAELERRGDAPAQDRVVRLPGLTVDPVQGLVTWRGDDYVVGGRRMEVLYGLATARRDGFRRLRQEVLAHRIWLGFDAEEAKQNLRVTAMYLRKQFPGLFDAVRVGTEVAVGLVLDEPATDAARVA